MYKNVKWSKALKNDVKMERGKQADELMTTNLLLL